MSTHNQGVLLTWINENSVEDSFFAETMEDLYEFATKEFKKIKKWSPEEKQTQQKYLYNEFIKDEFCVILVDFLGKINSGWRNISYWPTESIVGRDGKKWFIHDFIHDSESMIPYWVKIDADKVWEEEFQKDHTIHQKYVLRIQTDDGSSAF